MDRRMIKRKGSKTVIGKKQGGVGNKGTEEVHKRVWVVLWREKRYGYLSR